MEKIKSKSSGGNFVLALIVFIATAAIAILMLLVALVAWLSLVTGSLIDATLIVGGFFAVIAIIIYLLSIRAGIERIHERLETVYCVAEKAKDGYEWITEKVCLISNLWLNNRDRKSHKDHDRHKC